MPEIFYKPVLVFSWLCFCLVAALPWLGEMGMADPKHADELGLWLNFLGKFHPLFLHLPIGALAVVICLECVGVFQRRMQSTQITLALFLAMVTGVFAAVFGYFLYLTGAYAGELIEEHKRDGIVFTLTLIVTFVVKIVNEHKGRTRALTAIYVACMVVSGITVLCAGHHGGAISHGDPLEALPSRIKSKRQQATDAKPAVDPIVYTHYIHPILEDKCVSCHGEKKQKGALRLDTYALMLEGGEETTCLAPGNVQESSLISYLHLPLEDDLRMPPKNKPQLTQAEIQILEWWVKEGAPEHARLSELTTSPEIRLVLEGFASGVEPFE